MSQFQALLDTLNGVATDADTLKKSVPAAAEDAPGTGEGVTADEQAEDDEAIAAAAAEAEAKGEGKGETLGKSFEVVAEDGTKHEAVDATELVKSLMSRQEATEGNLMKAMEAMVGTVQKQGELIKSLTEKVAELSTQGRGRKSQLVVLDKPDTTLAKSGAGDKQGMSIDEFFVKANTAFDQGKITGKELTVIDVCKRSNQAIDPALVQKVINASA